MLLQKGIHWGGPSGSGAIVVCAGLVSKMLGGEVKGNDQRVDGY
jgi:hypothetical protein